MEKPMLETFKVFVKMCHNRGYRFEAEMRTDNGGTHSVHVVGVRGHERMACGMVKDGLTYEEAVASRERVQDRLNKIVGQFVKD